MANLTDLRGLSCPIPLLKTIEALSAADKVSVLVDEETPMENICKFAKGRNYTVECVESSEGYTIVIAK